VHRVLRPAAEILRLARERGISLVTLRRARQAMKTVVTEKRGFRAGWALALREGPLCPGGGPAVGGGTLARCEHWTANGMQDRSQRRVEGYENEMLDPKTEDLPGSTGSCSY